MRAAIALVLALAGVAHGQTAARDSAALNSVARDSSALDSTLAQDPVWLRLGHYTRDAGSPSGWLSEIHSDDFFLDPRGREDPVSELAATRRAFAAPEGAQRDAHAQCRFPARLIWLKSRVPDDPAFARRVECPALNEFTRGGTVTSLSVVFATGFLGNPASYYGHTLLKFNFRQDPGQTRLMDVSVNYGAIVAGHDSAVVYILKSVLGGYDGGFSHIQFYYFNHDYGENDLRDLWEYELVLPPEAVELVVAHSWEVLGKRYTYEFFRRNCAYRMAELIEVVPGVHIMPDHWPWIVPQALTQQLAVARLGPAPLIGQIRYLPSRQSRFYEKYRNLDPQEVAAVRGVATGTLQLEDSAFASMPDRSREAALDALLDYYQFVGNPLEKAAPELKTGYAKVLAARYRLEPEADAPPPAPPPAPHLSRGIGWLQLGTQHYSALGQTLSLRVRPTYYDVLDTAAGHVRNASLVMGDTQVEVRHGRSFVSFIDLVGVDSAYPGLTDLPGDSALAWKLHLGADQARSNRDDNLVARLQGDVGYGSQLTPAIYSAVYAGAALQNDRAGQGVGFARASVDVIVAGGARAAAKLNFEQRVPLMARTGGYGVLAFEARWSLNDQSDLRMTFRHDGATVAGVGVGLYW